MLPDEKQATTVDFLLRAVAWFDSQGISGKRVLSDNGSAYRSRPWLAAPPCSSSDCCGLLNDLVRKHNQQSHPIALIVLGVAWRRPRFSVSCNACLVDCS